MFEKTTFPNGLRVITVPMPQMESVSICVFVGAGSRFENSKNNGISHFLEHISFKGSNKYRNHKKIARTIEGLGGVTNAATDVEATYYWAKVLKRNFSKGLDVILDLVLNPLLRSKDIDRERGVLLEEIKHYEDLPESKVWDIFVKTVWPDQVLGQTALGTKEVIRNLKREDFDNYRQGYYIPVNMVVAAAGNITHARFIDSVSKYFSFFRKSIKPPLRRVIFKQKKPQLTVFKKDTEQAHIFLGVSGLNINHEDKYTLGVLSSILGEGLSSRLFIKIREEKSLAYYIGTHGELYQDAGIFGVHAGITLNKVEKALEEILRQLKIVKRNTISKRELREAKEKMKGPLLFKLENSDQMMLYFSQQELLTKKILTPFEVKEKIEAVTADDIKRLANELFVNKRLNLAIIGPYASSNRFRDILDIE